YWVYYDSVNHVLDSIYVTRNSTFSSEENGKNYIKKSIVIGSKFFPSSEWGDGIGTIGLWGNNMSFGFYFPKNNQNLSFPGFMFSTPFTYNISSKIISGIEYPNVLTLTNFSYPEQKDSLFVSKEIGVVKMKFPTTNTNYNLLRYKIVKNE